MTGSLAILQPRLRHADALNLAQQSCDRSSVWPELEGKVGRWFGQSPTTLYQLVEHWQIVRQSISGDEPFGYLRL